MITGKPLFTVDQIQEKVHELADSISEDYEGKDLIVVPILMGAFMFASDLVRHLRTPISLDFVMASSYVKENTTGDVKLHCDLRQDVRDRNVLLVEDIADTGITLNYVREMMLQRGPRSLKVCCLLDKRERRVADVPIDYLGFVIPNLYVVGYGLDYENKYRNLPYIAVFKKSA